MILEETVKEHTGCYSMSIYSSLIRFFFYFFPYFLNGLFFNIWIIHVFLRSLKVLYQCIIGFNFLHFALFQHIFALYLLFYCELVTHYIYLISDWAYQGV